MVDGLHIHIKNRMMKPLAIALIEAGRGLLRGDVGGNPTNIQCKAIHNCHNEPLLYNEYILIKTGETNPVLPKINI
jgi:hypothetical protein